MSQADCLFCRIVGGEVSAEVIHEGERVMAFRDIDPQAPVHVLIIPKAHISSLDGAGTDDADVLGEALLLAADIARREAVSESGYRTVVNTGADGGQTVPHVHVHLLGGRALRWPPG